MQEVWHKDNLRDILLAAEQTTTTALAAGGDGDLYAEGYKRGYRAALVTVALAIGVDLSQPVTWHVVGAGHVLEQQTNGKEQQR